MQLCCSEDMAVPHAEVADVMRPRRANFAQVSEKKVDSLKLYYMCSSVNLGTAVGKYVFP